MFVYILLTICVYSFNKRTLGFLLNQGSPLSATHHSLRLPTLFEAFVLREAGMIAGVAYLVSLIHVKL